MTSDVMLPWTYDWRFVILSAAIALFSAYAALDFAERVIGSTGWWGRVWILGGGFAFGSGIWSMHVVGMLGVHLPLTVVYDLPMVVASYVAALVGSWMAFYIVSRRRLRRVGLFAGATLVGLSISAMQYIGVAAMRLPANLHYTPWIVAASVAMAVTVSLAGLRILSRCRAEERRLRPWEKMGLAAVMGLAIAAMHSTGMCAVSFTESSSINGVVSRAIELSRLGAAVIVGGTVLIVGAALLTAMLARRLEAQTVSLEQNEARMSLLSQRVQADNQQMERLRSRVEQSDVFFRMLSEQLPVGVFEVNETGACIYKNRTWDEIFGHSNHDIFRFSTTDCPSGSWVDWFHPDDRPEVERAWARSKTTFIKIQQECRLVGSHSEPTWVRVLLWPMAGDQGFRFLGTIEDITERKRTTAETMSLLQEGRFELRTMSEALNLATLLAQACPDPPHVTLGLSELLLNGVEHGNLGISYDEKSKLVEANRFDEEIERRLAAPEFRDKRVRVRVSRSLQEIQLTITDEGAGFDWRRYTEMDGARSLDSHGRGIAMAKLFSFDRLEYRGNGNEVVAMIATTKPEPATGDLAAPPSEEEQADAA